jgi:hypothetical protein
MCLVTAIITYTTHTTEHKATNFLQQCTAGKATNRYHSVQRINRYTGCARTHSTQVTK